MVKNLGNALVIIASLYFIYNYKFSWWILGIICLMLLAWEISHHTKQQKELINAQIRTEQARALNFNAGSSQLITQNKLIARNLKNV